MRKRNLSEFMSIELLYDYKSGKLDPLRREAVDEALQSSPRVRDELKKITIGMSYCDKLKNVSVSEPLVDLILNEPKPTQKVFSKFKWVKLPQPVRWAFEAVIVAVAIALFVTQMPELFKGDSASSDSFVVKKFDGKPLEQQVEDSSDIQVDAKTPTTEPAEVAIAPEPSKEKDVVAMTPIVASKEIPLLLRPLQEEEEEEEVAGATPSTVATATPVTQEKPEPKPVEKPPVKKGNAYVYRMTMRVSDVDVVTPEIVTLITGLGGEKAGEVQLGWRRKGGSYFHFSIPLVNSPALREGLKKYSTFNVVKSAHTRVMPEDTERYILWVERIPSPTPEPDPATTTSETQEEAGIEGTDQQPTTEAVSPTEQEPPENTQETNEEN